MWLTNMIPLPSPTPSGARWPRRAAPSSLAARAGQRVAALLEHKAPIVRGLGRLHRVGLVAGVVPEPLEHGFIFLGGDALFFHAPADGNQEEHRPHGDAPIAPAVRPWRRSGRTLRRVMVVLTCTAMPKLPGVVEHAQGALEAARASRGRRRAWRRRRRRG